MDTVEVKKWLLTTMGNSKLTIELVTLAKTTEKCFFVRPEDWNQSRPLRVPKAGGYQSVHDTHELARMAGAEWLRVKLSAAKLQASEAAAALRDLTGGEPAAATAAQQPVAWGDRAASGECVFVTTDADGAEWRRKNLNSDMQPLVWAAATAAQPVDLPPLPRPFVPGDEYNPRDYYTAEQMREYGAACQPAAAAAAQPDAHHCKNCEGIDPGSCLFNPEAAATAAQPTQQPLTNEQIEAMKEAVYQDSHPAAFLMDFARAIEQAHGIGPAAGATGAAS